MTAPTNVQNIPTQISEKFIKPFFAKFAAAVKVPNTP